MQLHGFVKTNHLGYFLTRVWRWGINFKNKTKQCVAVLIGLYEDHVAVL